MTFEGILRSGLIENIGWTLVYSTWQIAAVGAVLFLILRIARGSDVRYFLSVAALVVAALIPVVTFFSYSASRPSARNAVAEAFADGAFGAPRTSALQGPAARTAAFSPVGSSSSERPSYLTTLRTRLSAGLEPVMPYLVGAWLIGFALFSLRLSGGIWQLRRRRRDGEEPSSEWATRFERLCRRLRIRENVKLLVSDSVAAPIAFGVLRPLVIIPASLFMQVSPTELETLIAHELIHIRRRDQWVAMLQGVIESILFYHPAVWWISAQIRREREFAADDAVTRSFEDSHVVYASALANLEEIRHLAGHRSPRHANAANGGNLMERINRILKKKTEIRHTRFAWSAGLGMLLISAALTTVFLLDGSSLINAESKASGRKLAIGFVSIPPLDRTANAPKDADATMRLLIDALKRHKMPATGFLQGGMISDGEKFLPVRKEIARMWIDAGFEVGLGGFKHMSLYDVSVEEYIANLEKNEGVAKKLLGDMANPPRYFSYPFLNTGKTTEDRAKVEAWLASRGYTSVKYSFDNQEWMYSWAYDMARNDNDVNTMREIRTAYLSYMEKMFDHYEAYSTEMFGRDIAQTMVLTSSRLVTDTADDFFAIARKRGYTFITVDEAQGDAAYKTRENFTGKAGISWFERWSMAQNRRLRDEPNVDAFVEKTWEARAKK